MCGKSWKEECTPAKSGLMFIFYIFLSFFLLPLGPASPAALKASCCMEPINILLLHGGENYFPTSPTRKEEAVVNEWKQWSCCSAPPAHSLK